MPILVHLTPEKNAKAIVRSGIKAHKFGPTIRGVFCMPLLPDYFVSHQWLRELKRGGQRTIVGVDFRLSSDEPVMAGHYGRPHVPMALGRAIGVIRGQKDARGFEIIVPRKILAKEVVRVRAVNQVIGWRYEPNAHGKPPCTCPMCLPRGSFKSAEIRSRLDR